MNSTKHKILLAASITALVLALGACSKEEKHEDSENSMTESHSKMEEHKEVHWSYSGEGAPDKWGSLKSEFSTCDSGMKQSPIDIQTAGLTKEAIPAIEVDYKPTPVDLVNNGHTIQQNYAPGSSITVGGKKYNLLQFHFHSPSEHTVNGKPADLVAHLVHKADDGQLGVIGVLMNAGAENPVIKALWDNMPMEMNSNMSKADVMVNAADLLTADLKYFNYSGSLTTPPCSEGVNWMVLANQRQVSQAQVDKFTGVFALSVRPVQVLNERVVKVN